MLSFRFAHIRPLFEPAGLAVAVTPLVFLACSMLAEQALGSTPQSGIAVQAINKSGDVHGSKSSPAHMQIVAGKNMAANRAIGSGSAVTGPLVKSQLSRRIAERSALGLSVRLGPSSFEPSLVADSVAPRVFDASSPEYLTLRQLRL